MIWSLVADGALRFDSWSMGLYMDLVIVTIEVPSRSVDGEPIRIDVEVPSDISMVNLTRAMANLLDLDSITSYLVRALLPDGSPEQTLGPHETLAKAGVWSGSWLIMQTVSVSDGKKLHAER
jgi:hypothetical protein